MRSKVIEQIGEYLVLRYDCGRYVVKSKDGHIRSGTVATFSAARKLAESYCSDDMNDCGKVWN